MRRQDLDSTDMSNDVRSARQREIGFLQYSLLLGSTAKTQAGGLATADELGALSRGRRVAADYFLDEEQRSPLDLLI